MRCSIFPFLALPLLSLAHVACSGDSPGDASAASSQEAIVEEVAADSADTSALAAADDLGADPEPMLGDGEIDRAADRGDDVQDEEAARELEAEIAQGDVVSFARPASVAAARAPRCKKRIHVTFAVYTFLTQNIGGNGCWIPERTTQDASFRDCHYDGTIKNPHGDKWFYDDTNPYNDLGRELSTLKRCSAGAKRGYEYMAFREGRWRLITEPHTSAYFAELYTDDQHIDDLYYVPGVYRGNRTLRAHARAFPMLNFAPHPDTYSQRAIGREVLKVCKTVKNHGYIGLYEWHYPIFDGSPRLRTIVQALDACTKR